MISRWFKIKHPTPAPSARPTWAELLHAARTGAALLNSPVHGDVHWRAVANVGLHIADQNPNVDREIVLAFAMLHDCRRTDECGDPWHGEAAANAFAVSSVLIGLLGNERADRVCQACRIHAEGTTIEDDETIGACLDADRLNLVRLAIVPRADFLSGVRLDTLPEMIAYAEEQFRDPPTWEALFAKV